MATWFGHYNTKQNFFVSLAYKVMKQGHIPKHVAIIMDGNRRFAKKENISKKDGHTKGFEKLAELLSWCYELDIPEVTVYAFSIENFKRSREEVDILLDIFRNKLNQLFEEKDTLMKYKICIRFLGDVSLFSPDIRKLIANVVDMCKDNDGSFLNIAMPYTSREEITQAIRLTAKGVKEEMIRESDITEELLEKCFYTNKSRPVDILIRTSEARLSDFLLWQSSFSILCFVDVMWPEFTLWQFFFCLLKFQYGYSNLENSKELSKLKETRAQMDNDLRCAHAELQKSFGTYSDSDLNVYVEEYTKKRLERQQDFLEHVERQRKDQLASYLEDSMSREE